MEGKPEIANQEKNSSFMEKMRQNVKIGALTMALGAFSYSCQKEKPHSDVLLKLAESDPNISKVDSYSLKSFEKLMDQAKKEEKTVFFDERRHMGHVFKDVIEVDTLDNSISVTSLMGDENKLDTMTVDFMRATDKDFAYRSTVSRPDGTPALSTLGVDKETGIVTSALHDNWFLPKGQQRSGYVVKQDGTKIGDPETARRAGINLAGAINSVEVAMMELSEAESAKILTSLKK